MQQIQSSENGHGAISQRHAVLYDAVVSGNIVLYPDAGMRAAVSQAVTVESARGLRIGKANVKKSKIDVVIALAMAVHAAVEDQAKPRGFLQVSGWESTAEPEERRGGRAAVAAWCEAIRIYG